MFHESCGRFQVEEAVFFFMDDRKEMAECILKYVVVVINRTIAGGCKNK